jgi:hypothetical protein
VIVDSEKGSIMQSMRPRLHVKTKDKALYFKTPLPSKKDKTPLKQKLAVICEENIDYAALACSEKPLFIPERAIPQTPPPIKHPKLHDGVPNAIAPSPLPSIVLNPTRMVAPRLKVARFPFKLVK